MTCPNCQRVTPITWTLYSSGQTRMTCPGCRALLCLEPRRPVPFWPRFCVGFLRSATVFTPVTAHFAFGLTKTQSLAAMFVVGVLSLVPHLFSSFRERFFNLRVIPNDLVSHDPPSAPEFPNDSSLRGHLIELSAMMAVALLAVAILLVKRSV